MTDVTEAGRQAKLAGSWARRVMLTVGIFLVGVVLVLWLELPNISHTDGPGDEFKKALEGSIVRNSGNYDLWYKFNIVVQCSLILAAILATVFASVTTRDNAEAIKKWSIFLTAVTAGLTSVQSTFHIRENLDTFVKVTTDLVLLQTDYHVARASTVEKLKAQGVDVSESSADETFQKEILSVQQQHMQRYTEILSARMRAWANVGQQAIQRPENRHSNSPDSPLPNREKPRVVTSSTSE